MKPFTDIDAINGIVNHPSLRRYTLAQEGETLDVAPLIQGFGAVFLGDALGGFLFVDRGKGIWEVHTQFLPGARGPRAAILAVQAARYMFTQSDCTMLTTFVADGNRAALDLATAVGFVKFQEDEVRGHHGQTMVFTLKDWARSLCQ